MEQIIPIKTIHLFPVLDKLLIELLTSLTPEDWHKPTLARLWNVKDIAAHLLDGNVRGIALLDNYQSEEPQPLINSYQDLVKFLNSLNAGWVNAMKRVSPQLLIRQLANTGEQYIAYLQTLDPFAPALYPVAWAGEKTSLNWFHIAREYTEKWHHQQQIREATGIPGIMTAELYYPCIATFMYALPHAYRNVAATSGTLIQFTVTGQAGGIWFLQKNKAQWAILKQKPNQPVAVSVMMEPDIVWKFFTNAIPPDIAIKNSFIQGDPRLASVIFNTLAVMV